MKKLLSIVMVMCALVLFAGCAKDTTADEDGKRVFTHSYVEEIEGQNVDINHVVVFNEDGTGAMSIQDEIPFTYDDAKITNEDGSLVYDYVIDGEKLTINFGEVEEEFTLYHEYDEDLFD